VQVCEAFATFNSVLPSYHFRFITFGSQFISTSAVPVYLESVSLSHGAVALFDAIPDANESAVKKHKNNKLNFFINSPFFLALTQTNSPPGAGWHESGATSAVTSDGEG
jgi:hypothetical protein